MKPDKIKPLHNRGRIPINEAEDLECICCDIFDDFLSNFQQIEGLTEAVSEEMKESCGGEIEHWTFMYTDKGMRLAERMRDKLIEVCEAHFPAYNFTISSGYFQEI